MIRALRLARARAYARIVRFRLGSDTPAYAEARAAVARLRSSPFASE
ncbi:hypothetical protein [Sphingomonas jatrophae]|uniref:Uncharacterized protein n=1 Tax=Sphingomonas jatrophae TaxID=1166337 RepID=A0A1I6LDX7_9SPHN|nr:hypothetical protein [Sphingomonas jatrophae]SFS01649.1 hypothetical protein SAMN05192580_2624 [Sphingomonas jatrophae]